MSTTPQHMAALENAHAVRRAQSELRHALAAAELSLSAALQDPRAQRMTLADVLEAQYSWGADRCWKALCAAGRLLWPHADDPPALAPYMQVGEMRERERAALLRVCGRTDRRAAA